MWFLMLSSAGNGLHSEALCIAHGFCLLRRCHCRGLRISDYEHEKAFANILKQSARYKDNARVRFASGKINIHFHLDIFSGDGYNFSNDFTSSSNCFSHVMYMKKITALLFAVLSGAGYTSQAQTASDTMHTQANANWKDYSIIDIHAHIGSFKGYDLRTETLLDNLTRHHIHLALISNIDGAALPDKTLDLDEVTANRITLQTVRANPALLRGLAWARPLDGSPQNLEPFLRDHGFVGVKLHPEMNHFPADDPRVDGYLELCARYDVPAVFHSDQPGSNAAPDKIYAAARRHPTVPIILYHMVFGGPHDAAVDVAKQALQKKDATLFLETSQADPTAALKAVGELGSARVLFGSDATYYGVEHYKNYIAFVETLHKELSEEDFAKVMHENAERLFKLEASKKWQVKE
jgi:hypothetical protein